MELILFSPRLHFPQSQELLLLFLTAILNHLVTSICFSSNLNRNSHSTCFTFNPSIKYICTQMTHLIYPLILFITFTLSSLLNTSTLVTYQHILVFLLCKFYIAGMYHKRKKNCIKLIFNLKKNPVLRADFERTKPSVSKQGGGSNSAHGSFFKMKFY